MTDLDFTLKTVGTPEGKELIKCVCVSMLTLGF